MKNEKWREYRGVFYTPPQWVVLSQQYIARALGENWQDEYYVWDCAAGTGNLLVGLKNRNNTWASTIDPEEVAIMKQRIHKDLHLLEDHIFQFDFLNDEWRPISQGGKMPDDLYEIVTDPEKQKRLLIYINPPYAEPGNARTVAGTGTHKTGVSTNNRAYKKYGKIIGQASREIFALFITRVYDKMPNCKIAFFAKPKFIQGDNFYKFRNLFLASYKCGFMVPAYTFENVTGEFPIVFSVWDCNIKQSMSEVKVDIYNETGEMIGNKTFKATGNESITNWILKHRIDAPYSMGILNFGGNDFQNQNLAFIHNKATKTLNNVLINQFNIIPVCVYFAVRHCIKANWLNNRDYFYYPDESWENDREFIADCVIYTLFHNKNYISTSHGDNHWIPFPESMVNARAKYKHHTMIDFLEGNPSCNYSLFSTERFRILDYLSDEAKAVYEAGLKLWQYYHSQSDANPDASFYDIKVYFKGLNPDGHLKQRSNDATFNDIMNELRKATDLLATKIANKTYEHGFLLSSTILFDTTNAY